MVSLSPGLDSFEIIIDVVDTAGDFSRKTGRVDLHVISIQVVAAMAQNCGQVINKNRKQKRA